MYNTSVSYTLLDLILHSSRKLKLHFETPCLSSAPCSRYLQFSQIIPLQLQFLHMISLRKKKVQLLESGCADKTSSSARKKKDWNFSFTSSNTFFSSSCLVVVFSTRIYLLRVTQGARKTCCWLLQYHEWRGAKATREKEEKKTWKLRYWKWHLSFSFWHRQVVCVCWLAVTPSLSLSPYLPTRRKFHITSLATLLTLPLRILKLSRVRLGSCCVFPLALFVIKMKRKRKP